MINNLRDLGGIPADDGRKLKNRQFLRSARLVRITDEDCSFLTKSCNVSLIVDLRTDGEVVSKPDRLIPGAAWLHFPLGKETGIGARQGMSALKQRIAEADSTEEKISLLPYAPALYRSMLRDSFAKVNYPALVNFLLGYTAGASLFHCTSGKDRTGMTAAGILLALGVSRPNIMEDYMKSYDSSKYEADLIYETSMEKGADELFAESMRQMIIVKEENMMAFFDEIDNQFGSTENFIRYYLKIDDDKLKQIRDARLE